MREVYELIEAVQDAGDAAGARLDAFVAAHEFPIVEDDTAFFFYWDGEPLDEVLLVHWVFGLESHIPFHRIGTTDAYYLPVELPRDGRVEYKLERVRDGERSWIRDPLNPRRAHDPFGSNSVCPMPGYRVPPWVARDPDTRRGRIEDIDVFSRVFGGPRTVRAYLPARFRLERRKPYPLLVCHDGDDYLRFAGIAAVLDTLIHRNEVMPLVVVFTSGHDRTHEYAANPLQARFLVEEVLPTVRKSLPVSEDPAEVGLMGASFGAVSSLFTAWSHPGVFGNLLLQSGSFVFTDVGHHQRGALWDPVVTFVNRFRDDPGRVAARIYQSCGTFESLIHYNRSLVPLLRGAGLDVRFEESRDGHNWIAWRDRLRSGLTWLYPGHLWMVYD